MRVDAYHIYGIGRRSHNSREFLKTSESVEWSRRSAAGVARSSALEDDCRTFMRDFVARLPEMEFPPGVTF